MNSVLIVLYLSTCCCALQHDRMLANVMTQSRGKTAKVKAFIATEKFASATEKLKDQLWNNAAATVTQVKNHKPPQHIALLAMCFCQPLRALLMPLAVYFCGKEIGNGFENGISSGGKEIGNGISSGGKEIRGGIETLGLCLIVVAIAPKLFDKVAISGPPGSGGAAARPSPGLWKGCFGCFAN